MLRGLGGGCCWCRCVLGRARRLRGCSSGKSRGRERRWCTTVLASCFWSNIDSVDDSSRVCCTLCTASISPECVEPWPLVACRASYLGAVVAWLFRRSSHPRRMDGLREGAAAAAQSAGLSCLPTHHSISSSQTLQAALRRKPNMAALRSGTESRAVATNAPAPAPDGFIEHTTSSSNHPANSLGSSNQARGRSTARDGLPFTGILSDDEVSASRWSCLPILLSLLLDHLDADARTSLPSAAFLGRQASRRVRGLAPLPRDERKLRQLCGSGWTGLPSGCSGGIQGGAPSPSRVEGEGGEGREVRLVAGSSGEA